MTDKEKLIKIKSLADKMYYAAFNMTTDASLLRKAMKEYRQFIIHEYCKEEPVSEDLEEEIDNYIKWNGYDGLDSREEVKYIANHFAKWQKESLWKPADGDDLPEYEREVVVFTQDFPNDAGIMKVAIAHIPNHKGFDGKSLLTGKVEHYTHMAYGQGRWNIPDVKYWLDVELPK